MKHKRTRRVDIPLFFRYTDPVTGLPRSKTVYGKSEEEAAGKKAAFLDMVGKGISLSKSSAQAVSIAEYITAHAFSRIVPIDAQRAAQAKKEWTRTPFREIGQTRWTMVGFGSIGGIIALVVAAVMLGTAAVGSCPLYLPLHIDTHQPADRVG